MKKKHSLQVRKRAFALWQELGYNPWQKPAREGGDTSKKTGIEFYKGAFDSIPFLNKDAKRTFQHLLLRPGYMIRDYIRGDHENYLAPLTALIVFYAFFALVSSVLQPVQRDDEIDLTKGNSFRVEQVSPDQAKALVDEMKKELEMDPEASRRFSFDTERDSTSRAVSVFRKFGEYMETGYTYLHLDQRPQAVKNQHQASLAALENTLRSQGIPLFLGQFFLLWLAMCMALRRFKLKMSACAAASAYILCQFSFFMLFAVLLTWGKSTSISITLMFLLLVWDYRQWLGLSWGKSAGRALSTGIWYGLVFVGIICLVSALVFLFAYLA